MSIKKREVVSHPNVLKLISVISALFLVGTLAVNGFTMLSSMQLDWGFFPNKTIPNIQASYNGTTHDVAVYVPFYVNNTGMFGFDVVDLQADFTLSNSSGIITTKANGPWEIPHGGNLTASLGLAELNNETLYLVLSSGAAVSLSIDFHVTYAFATTNIAVRIDFPGGLTFT